MVPSLLIWIGTFTVGVTSNPDLKWGPADADKAAQLWMQSYVPGLPFGVKRVRRPQPAIKGAAISGARRMFPGVTRTDPVPARPEEGGLHFELTGLEIPRISAFSFLIERWLHAEIARGWRTTGDIGAPGPDGTREAAFKRTIRDMYPWTMPGVAHEVPCAPLVARAETVACYFVQSGAVDGSTRLKLGPGAHLRIHPRALVAVDRTPQGMSARVRTLVIVKRVDVDQFVANSPRFGRYAQQFAALAPNEPATVDTNQDGVMDAWRFEGAATFAVTLGAQL